MKDSRSAIECAIQVRSVSASSAASNVTLRAGIPPGLLYDLHTIRLLVYVTALTWERGS